MRRVLLIFLLTVPLWAQSKSDKPVVEYVRTLRVSAIDRTLPDVSLDYFLRYETEGAAINWQRIDCPDKRQGPFRQCVQADAFLANRGAVTVSISVDSPDQRSFSRPELIDVYITELSGLVRPVHRLRDLPMELHRRTASR
ncbi:MAG TPA: hypothetical protein VN577_17370 [Terriglobales bacterium]|nr:hypothetical protein [Terriglobales bacterium]